MQQQEPLLSLTFSHPPVPAYFSLNFSNFDLAALLQTTEAYSLRQLKRLKFTAWCNTPILFSSNSDLLFTLYQAISHLPTSDKNNLGIYGIKPSFVPRPNWSSSLQLMRQQKPLLSLTISQPPVPASFSLNCSHFDPAALFSISV